MRIAVTGRQGQVVTALLERGPEAGTEIIAVGRPQLDLADGASVRSVLSALNPDAIVSAAAYTAVDKAESDEGQAFAVNAKGAEAVAQVAAELGVPIVHISTDYVFSGTKQGAYDEADATGPISVYGRSKLAGELAVAAAGPNHAILRTAWVYSPFGTNFVKTMLRLGETRDVLNVVADQHGTPTSALDIADAVIAVAKRLAADANPELRGIFHLAGDGEASWADFADEIFAGLEAKTGKVVSVSRITTADYPTPATRPANSLLSTKKLQQRYGIALPHWKKSAQVVLDRLL